MNASHAINGIAKQLRNLQEPATRERIAARAATNDQTLGEYMADAAGGYLQGRGALPEAVNDPKHLAALRDPINRWLSNPDTVQAEAAADPKSRDVESFVAWKIVEGLGKAGVTFEGL